MINIAIRKNCIAARMLTVINVNLELFTLWM